MANLDELYVRALAAANPSENKKTEETTSVQRSRYTDEFGPNVQRILIAATRVIRGKIPNQVRAELRAAVKAGVLGHLKKDGLKPEVFYHPDHKHGAIERQRKEAEYAIENIKRVIG